MTHRLTHSGAHCVVALWQEAVAQYTAIAADLERVLPQGAGSALARQSGGEDALQALPAALSNLHSLLIHVAARLDRLHEHLADAKEAHLANLAAVRSISPDGSSCLYAGRVHTVSCSSQDGTASLVPLYFAGDWGRPPLALSLTGRHIRANTQVLTERFPGCFWGWRRHCFFSHHMNIIPHCLFKSLYILVQHVQSARPNVVTVVLAVVCAGRR